MRTVKVNNRPVEVPDNANGNDVKIRALAAGIMPANHGHGGVVELRGYLPSGGAELIGDNMRIVDWKPKRDRWKHTFTEFGFREVERSNALRYAGRTYWPASPGRLNAAQIRAAVKDTKIWSYKNVLQAIEHFQKEGQIDFDWVRDDTSQISQNAPGAQFDDGFTVTQEQGERLIELMKTDATERRARWARQKSERGPRKQPVGVHRRPKDAPAPVDGRQEFWLRFDRGWRGFYPCRNVGPYAEILKRARSRPAAVLTPQGKVRFWGNPKPEVTLNGVDINVVDLGSRWETPEPLSADDIATIKNWER